MKQREKINNSIVMKKKDNGSMYFKLAVLPAIACLISVIGQAFSSVPSGREIIAMIIVELIFLLVFVFFVAMGMDTKNWCLELEREQVIYTDMFQKKTVYKYSDITRCIYEKDGIVSVMQGDKRIFSVNILMDGYEELQRNMERYGVRFEEGVVNENNHTVHFPKFFVVIFYAGFVMFLWVYWLTIKQGTFFSATTFISMIFTAGILYMAVYYTLDKTSVSGNIITQTNLFRKKKVVAIQEISYMQEGKSKGGTPIIILYRGKEKVLDVPSKYVNSDLFIRKMEMSHVKWKK